MKAKAVYAVSAVVAVCLAVAAFAGQGKQGGGDHKADGVVRMGDGPARYKLEVSEKEEKLNQIQIDSWGTKVTSTFKLYDVSGGGRKLLWTKDAVGRQMQNWVTNSGVIWVAISPTISTGKPSAGSVICWSAEGSELAVFPGVVPSLVDNMRIRGPVKAEPVQDEQKRNIADPAGGDGMDWKKSTAETYPKEDNQRGEALHLVRDGGDTTTLLLLLDGNGQATRKYNLGLWNQKPGSHKKDRKDEPLLKALASDRNNMPKPVRSFMLRGMETEFWEAKGRGGAETMAWLQAERDYQSFSDQVFIGDIQASQKIDRVPEYNLVTPSGTLLLFNVSEKDRLAQMQFLDWSLQKFEQIDLLKMGGFKSVKELQEKLIYSQINALTSRGWKKPEQGDYGSFSNREYLDLYDEDGRRFLWVIGASPEGKKTGVTAEVFEAGLLSRRPLVGEVPKEFKPTYSTTPTSPDGRFALKVRSWDTGRKEYRYTGNYTFTINVKGRPVELWTHPNYGTIYDAVVTKSGRSYVVISSESKDRDNKPEIRGSVKVYEPDGTQIAEVPLQDFLGARTVPEAAAKVDWSRTTVAYNGTAFEKAYDGFRAQLWPREAVTFHLKDGTTRTLEIGVDPKFGRTQILRPDFMRN